MSKKNIITNIVVLHLFFILLILSRKYVLNYQLTIKDILIKYGEVLLIGLFIVIYPKLMNRIFKIKDLLKDKKIDFFICIKTIFIAGIITFGIGMGTSLLFVFILLLDNKIVISQIIYFYTICIIGGVIFSIIMLTTAIIFNKIKQKKDSEKIL